MEKPSQRIRICSARLADAPLIAALAAKIWPEVYAAILSRAQIDYMLGLMYSVASLEAQMTTKGHRFRLLYCENKSAGFASFGEAGETGVFKLHKLYVDPNLHGYGLGKALLHEITCEVIEAGGSALELNVNRYNKARGFYEKLGFEIVREEDIDIGNGFQMNDFVMRKKLREL